MGTSYMRNTNAVRGKYTDVRHAAKSSTKLTRTAQVNRDQSSRVNSLVAARQLRSSRHMMVAILGCLVVLAASLALMVPAISMTHGDLVCGMEEHAHADACYEQVLVCGLEDGEVVGETDDGEAIVHEHTADCYEDQLTCDKPVHKHSDACYAEAEEPAKDADKTPAKKPVAAAKDAGDKDAETPTTAVEAETATTADEAETSYPAQTFEESLKDKDGNITFTAFVEAPEGALPDGTTMELRSVKAKDVKSEVEAAISYNPELADTVKAANTIAVSLTFKDADGEKIDPAVPVKAKLTTAEVRDMDDPVLVHVLDKKKALKAGKLDEEGNPKEAELVEEFDVVNQDEDDETEGTEDTLKFEPEDSGEYAIVDLQDKEAGDDEEGEGEDGEDAEDAEGEIPAGTIITNENLPEQSFSETLTDGNGDTLLTVDVVAPEGALPANATMKITPITEDAVLDAAVEQAASETAIEQERAQVVAVDITFYDADDNQIEPQAEVHVSMKAPAIEKQEDVAVVHVDDDNNAQVLEAAEVDPAAATAEFDSADFSVYALVYTVDFAWEVDGKTYEFSMPGGGFVSFEALVETLGVAKADEAKQLVAEVEKLEFSDPKLVWVGKVEEETTVGSLKETNELECEYSAELTDKQIEDINGQQVEAGDWALISLKPFTSNETLTVTMKNGDVFTIKVTDRASDNPQNTKIARSQMNVDNRDEGIIIKLFDYSGTVNNQNIDAVWGNSTNSNALRGGTGVNNGRTLVFSGSGLANQEWYNNFTGERPSGMDYYSGFRQEGIVKDELVNGYPELSDSINRYGTDDGNLDYLFKAGEQSGVTEYSANGQGLQGLLRKDANGYYYYSSEDNYARLDSSNQYIDLYTDTYFKRNGQAAANNNGFGSIGFFPFTNYNPNQIEEKGPNTPNNLYYNHQIGMSMQAAFTYPPNGTLDNGNPMTFEFSGDDDVWVYVDGKLALDLGGVHQPIKGVIDFAAKEVRYYEYNAYNSTNSPKTDILTTVSFDEIFGEGGFDDSAYSAHKIDFFFLERGGCDSNCALSFNLQTLATAEKEFMKVDDNNRGLPGAQFTIYTDEECTVPLSIENQPMVATSDEAGKVLFSGIPVRRDANREPLLYYMKETETPGGYQSNPTIYKLVYDETTKTYAVLTLDDEASEPVVNTPIQPIELGVEKQWQDAAGNPVTPGNDYSATFELHRLRSYETPDVIVVGDEETLRIRHVANDSGWGTSGEQIYKYLRGQTVTINYDYHGRTSTQGKREYRYRTNNGTWNYSGALPDTGSFNVQIPNNGQYEIEFYDTNNVVTWTIDDGGAQGETVVDELDPDFVRTLTLENGETSGAFDSGMYAGTANAGKFPIQEEIDDITYTYKYYITETNRTPNNNTSIFVDADGKVISNPATNYLENDTTQQVINRELLNIPFEKYWDFGMDEDPGDYTWTATFQLQSRFVDEHGTSVTSFEDVEGRQLTVTSEDGGLGSFDDLPMYGVYEGVEYRIQYSEAEIAYTVKNGDTVVSQWQDPEYYDDPLPTVGPQYSLHYIQDAGENGATIADYNIIVNNTPENWEITKEIEIPLQKVWPDGLELPADAHADFVLKRYVYEEYRNFPTDTTDWVNITLNTGNGEPQTMRVPQGWEMTIFGNVKAETNASSITFSNGPEAFSYDNSASDSEHTFAIQFVANETKTVTLTDGAQYVAGGVNGFRLTDINDPNDMVIRPDRGFEVPVVLNDANDWHSVLRHLVAIEEDTQYGAGSLEITRHVYRYYLEEVGCEPEEYIATFKDSEGNLFGDEGNKIDNTTTVTAENNLKPGSLEIAKSVTVNHGAVPSGQTALVDGEYTFTITGAAGTPTEGESATATVTISGGQATTKKIDNLVPGPYIVTEVAPTNGTSLEGDNGIEVTVVAGETESVDTASFTNNINVTDITFGKAWMDEDKTTPLSGMGDTIVTYTLMQVAENADGEHVRNDVYEGLYFLNGVARTATANAPCILYVSQNDPVTVTGLPTSGTVGGEPVTFTYYVMEMPIEGFVGDFPAPVSEGDYTITNSKVPETSKTTDVTVEKVWEGEDADQIGGVKYKLVQERAELPSEGANAFYPFVIHLRDKDGEMRQPDVVRFVQNGTTLNIPVEGSGFLPGEVRMGTTVVLSGGSFRIASIVAARSIELQLTSLLPIDHRWGVDWQLGNITAERGVVSDTPKTFIDGLNEDSLLTYEPTEFEVVVNMPAKGSSAVVGGAYETTNYDDEWKSTVNGLPYYDRGADGKYYTYRYRVVEVSIIDADGTEIETVTQNADGTGGESDHFIVEYDNSGDPLKITNTKRPDTAVTLKKVDKANVGKDPLEASDLLDGAKFQIVKYKKIRAIDGVDELDGVWNDEHSAESAGQGGVFTFDGLIAGYYKIDETEFPPGYNTTTVAPIFRVNDDANLSIDLIEPETGQAIEGNQTDMLRVVDGEATIVVGNESGAALPHTGGHGTTVFAILGTLLVALAGAWLFATRRRSLATR